MKKRKMTGFTSPDLHLVLGFIVLMAIGMYVVLGKIVANQFQATQFEQFYSAIKNPDNFLKHNHQLVAVNGIRNIYQDKELEEKNMGLSTTLYKKDQKILIKYQGMDRNMCIAGLLTWDRFYATQNVMKMMVNGTMFSGQIDKKKISEVCLETNNFFTFFSQN
jgi:uncharacterized protein YbcV (DUF1398 family)